MLHNELLFGEWIKEKKKSVSFTINLLLPIHAKLLLYEKHLLLAISMT